MIPPAPAARPSALSCSDIRRVVCSLGLRRPPLSVLCPLGQWTGLRRLSFEQQNTGLTPYSSKFNLARIANQVPRFGFGTSLGSTPCCSACPPPGDFDGVASPQGARVPNASFRGTHAKAEGLFSNRAASRRGGHFDHLRDSNSQLSSFPHACQ